MKDLTDFLFFNHSYGLARVEFCFALRYRWVGTLCALDMSEVADDEGLIIVCVHHSMENISRLQAASSLAHVFGRKSRIPLRIERQMA